MKVTVIPIVVDILWKVSKSLEQIREFRNQRNLGDHRDYSIVNASLNIQKNPQDLRRLTATQTPVKDQQLRLVWKTRKERNNSIRRSQYGFINVFISKSISIFSSIMAYSSTSFSVHPLLYLSSYSFLYLFISISVSILYYLLQPIIRDLSSSVYIYLSIYLSVL